MLAQVVGVGDGGRERGDARKVRREAGPYIGEGSEPVAYLSTRDLTRNKGGMPETETRRETRLQPDTTRDATRRRDDLLWRCRYVIDLCF